MIGLARLTVIALLAFMTLPTVVVIVASFNATAILAFPPDGLSLRWYVNALTYPQFERATVNSLVVTLASAAIALPFGTAAALALVRHPLRGGALWSAFLLSPLVIPGVAAGLGLLIMAAKLGVLTSRWVLIVAHVALVLPFVIRSVAVSVANLDPALERAAASLGAPPWRVFARVTLPLSMPGIASGCLVVLAWTFSAFPTPELLGGGRVKMVANVVKDLALDSLNWPGSAAFAGVALVVTLAVLAAMSRLLGRIDR